MYSFWTLFCSTFSSRSRLTSNPKYYNIAIGRHTAMLPVMHPATLSSSRTSHSALLRRSNCPTFLSSRLSKFSRPTMTFNSFPSKRRSRRLFLIILSLILVFFISCFHHSTTASPSSSPSSSHHSQSFSITVIASRHHSISHVRKTFHSLRSILPSASAAEDSDDEDVEPHLVHFSHHPSQQFASFTPHYKHISSQRLYDDPVLLLSSHTDSGGESSDSSPISSPSSSSTLYIIAGTVLSPAAFEWLNTARRAYAHRPDVAAFVLDSVTPVRKKEQPQYNNNNNNTLNDHDPSVWTPVPEHVMSTSSSQSAFIFRACPQATAIMPNFPSHAPHFRPWSVFLEWLRLRRGDWYKFPSGPGVDNTPLGISALPERNWTRAPWNVWFSKFLHEYQLGVVYPYFPDGSSSALAANGDVDPSGAFPIRLESKNPSALSTSTHVRDETLNGMKELPSIEGEGEGEGDNNTSSTSTLVTLLGNGQEPAKGYFSDDTMEKIEEIAKEQSGVISFTMVNKIFIETARSWLCNVDGGGFRPHGLLWAVTDHESYEALKGIQGTSAIWLNEVTGGKSTGHKFGSPGYWKLMLERTALITEILHRGIAVFAFETDAIWLQNPQPFIDYLLEQDADIVGTINTRMEVSGNFFYLRPTLTTRRLWQEITNEFNKAFKSARFDRKKENPEDSWTYIENDQSLLTKLVLRNHTWRASYPLNFVTLDMEKFVDGRWYTPEQGFYKSERARTPVVINNNFVIGVEEKTERAKKHGHWFWNEEKEECDMDAVRKAVIPSN